MNDHHAPNENARTRLLNAALTAAGRGWHVFPCSPGGKPPALRGNWKNLSTADPGIISAWWSARPYNIGIDCGKSGLTVLDLDVPGHSRQGVRQSHHQADRQPDTYDDRHDDRHHGPGIDGDGLHGLIKICEREGHPVPGTTFTVRTPSGGYHLYYRSPKSPPIGSSAGQLHPLIDVRGIGGYVIAAGSLIGGRPYEVRDDAPPQPIPDWLARMLKKPEPPPRTGSPLPAPRPGGALSPYGQKALTAEASTVAQARRLRHVTLNRAAFNLGQLVAAGHLTEAEVTRELQAAAAQTGLSEYEITRTITGGLAAGQANPRQPAPSPRTPGPSPLAQRARGPLPNC